MRHGQILAVFGFFLPLPGCSGAASGTDPATSAFLADAISGLESLRKGQPDPEQPACDAAIDALKRLRDHRSWPLVNTPIEQDLLHGTWIREGRSDGYREELHFGHDTSGYWDREKGYVPTEFFWLIEGRHLRLLSQSYYRESCNYQYLDRTYEYEFRGDHLVLRRNGEVLQWIKSAK
ncbi:MAG TPA: hypothetical protein VEN81_05160 [Planctomycetota bacterium]|nr:hypothetical protein [Planctomycetota bacterium]